MYLIEVDQGSKQISKLSDDALVVGELILNCNRLKSHD